MQLSGKDPTGYHALFSYRSVKFYAPLDLLSSFVLHLRQNENAFRFFLFKFYLKHAKWLLIVFNSVKIDNRMIENL